MALTSDQETLEHRMKVQNMLADTNLKIEQTRWEPWKALSAAFGAGVAVASGLLALGVWAGAHLLH